MSSQTTAVQKYTGDTLTEDQFNELVQTMNVGVLTMTQRSSFLFHYAKSLGLDPTTKPFDLIPGQNGKLIIYANRACSDQLRKIHNLSIETRYKGWLRLSDTEVDKSVYSVEVRVSTPDGRFEDHIGNVGIDGLMGDGMANASMKAHTKASRRATIAICGLGMLDETEVGFAAAPTVTVEANPSTDTAPIAKPKLIDARPLPAAAPPAKV